jgi:hypothetical protein
MWAKAVIVWGVARAESEMCSTNPISRLRVADCGLGEGGCGRAPEAKCAKQDAHDKGRQVGLRPAFWGGYQRSIRLTPTFVVGVKQTQFPAGSGGPRPRRRGPTMQNKPNVRQPRKMLAGTANPRSGRGAGSTRGRRMQNEANPAWAREWARADGPRCPAGSGCEGKMPSPRRGQDVRDTKAPGFRRRPGCTGRGGAIV